MSYIYAVPVALTNISILHWFCITGSFEMYHVRTQCLRAEVRQPGSCRGHERSLTFAGIDHFIFKSRSFQTCMPLSNRLPQLEANNQPFMAYVRKSINYKTCNSNIVMLILMMYLQSASINRSIFSVWFCLAACHKPAIR